MDKMPPSEGGDARSIRAEGTNKNIPSTRDIFICVILSVIRAIRNYNIVTFTTLSSPSLKRIRRTPWVARPEVLMDLKGRRMVWPLADIIITSFSSESTASTTRACTSCPVLPVMAAVLIPLPPRPLHFILCQRSALAQAIGADD